MTFVTLTTPGTSSFNKVATPSCKVESIKSLQSTIRKLENDSVIMYTDT